MSWNLFKGLQPRKSIPTEKDIVRECTRIQHVEDTSKKLTKEARKLADASIAFGKAGLKIGSDLVNLTDNTEKCPGSVITDSFMEGYEKVSQDKNDLYQKTLVEPMRKYTTAFPPLNAHIKAHEKVQQDYKKLQVKVDKLKEKEETGPNMVKMQNLKRELMPVKEEFDSKHTMLLDEFPAFYNSRLQYLQPIFESLIMTQCWYHNELREIFAECPNEYDQESYRNHDEDVQATLEQIRGLSITKD